MNKWWIATACAAGVLAGVIYASISHEPVDRLAPYPTLLESFSRVVFESDFGARGEHTPLDKWIEPIRIRLHGKYTEKDKRYLSARLALFERLTDLRFSFDDRDPNMEIQFFGSDDEVAKWAAARNVSPETIKSLLDHTCFAVTFGYNNGPLSRAYVTVLEVESEKDLQVCLDEEIVQALGLPADLALYSPSLFSNVEKGKQFSINDKVLLRALYDIRIRPQMTQEAAMPVARQIIRELHDAVESRGEEALYQR